MFYSDNDFAALAGRAAQRLTRMATTVRQVEPVDTTSIELMLPELASPVYLHGIDKSVRSFVGPKMPAMYIFRMVDEDTYGDLVEAYLRRPACRPGFRSVCKYSRLNLPVDPTALYVGSSWSLPSRVAQHLGRIGGDGTYAMRLSLWATSVAGKAELQLWQFANDIDPIELEAIEQQAWDELKPLLGKRSGK